ncbi:MAG TPA: CpXC domain-containing protein, partial [Roseiflexaceae bacterium]|nr:CpXC domain-containing protein [Roseiflexaceae bacterium]
MSISRSEQYTVVCPSCAAHFGAELWSLVDTGERPDLRDLLLEGVLNRVGCPRCGEEFTPDAPFMLHDQAARRVYFGVPAGVAEHTWREQAQSLLYDLVAELPEEQRLPYLGDVQLEQELDGVRRALTRQNRRRRAAPQPQPSLPAAAVPVPERSELIDTLQLLLSADSAADFERIARSNPDVLSDAADAVLQQAINDATSQGERDMARALERVRVELARLRAPATPTADHSELPLSVQAGDPALSSTAYQSFLHADSPDELLNVVRSHPQLLELSAEERIARLAEQALDEGNERLAAAIASRHEALSALRAELTAPGALDVALGQLLQAHGEEALAEHLDAYPALLTEAAQVALAAQAVRARSQGDEAGAVRAL